MTTTPAQIADSIGEFMIHLNRCDFVTPDMEEESFARLEEERFEIPFPEWVTA